MLPTFPLSPVVLEDELDEELEVAEDEELDEVPLVPVVVELAPEEPDVLPLVEPSVISSGGAVGKA